MLSDNNTVVLATTWRSRSLVSFAPMILLAWLAVLVADQSRGVLFWLVASATVVITGIILFDYPITVLFDDEGIKRRCVLRTETLSWERVDSIRRSPINSLLNRRESSAGLVAIQGRSKYLLTDRCESRQEFAALEQGMKHWDVAHIINFSAPPITSPPTWLYKQRTPQGGVRRKSLSK